MNFLLGTLTEKGGQGILLLALDGDQLSFSWSSARLKEPNWLLRTRDGSRVFTVHEDKERPVQGLTGFVAELAIEKEGFRVVSSVPSGGDAPCYLALSPDERFLYAANYVTGSIGVFPIENGLLPAVQLICHTGVGFDHQGRQKGPHMHQVSFMKSGELLAADLGLDALYIYAQNKESGLLAEKTRIPCRLGSGPRHIACLDESAFYLAHEMGSLVTLFEKEDGSYREKQSLSTLPPYYQGFNAVAAIRLSPDKKRLYVSNRGHDSIAEYLIAEDNRLAFSRFIPCGAFPRDFLVLDDGRFLVADQGSNDPGMAVRLGSVTLLSAAGAPLCVLPCPAAVALCQIGGAR